METLHRSLWAWLLVLVLGAFLHASSGYGSTIQIGLGGTPQSVGSSYTFNQSVSLPGASYSVAGTLSQLPRSGAIGTALLLSNLQIKNTGTRSVSDSIVFASDPFASLPLGVGGVILSGNYANASGLIGFAQASLTFEFGQGSTLNPLMTVIDPGVLLTASSRSFSPTPVFAVLPAGVDHVFGVLNFTLGTSGDSIQSGTGLGLEVLPAPAAEPSTILLSTFSLPLSLWFFSGTRVKAALGLSF